MMSNNFQQYINGYTVENFLHYPFRRLVTKASALKYGFVVWMKTSVDPDQLAS